MNWIPPTAHKIRVNVPEEERKALLAELDFFGVDPTTGTFDDLRKAYHVKAMAAHPDLLRSEPSEAFIKLNERYKRARKALTLQER